VTGQVDTINGTAEYRTKDREWRISGASTVTGAGNTVTIHFGSTIARHPSPAVPRAGGGTIGA
jgi:hypothetical protein